ncbi:31252_t:CDS:1, partial [Racocetra persica]
YSESTKDDLKRLKDSGKVKATHDTTKVWVSALERFQTDVGYQDKIEDITDKNVLKEQLSKFIYTMKKQDETDYHVSSIRNCAAAL